MAVVHYQWLLQPPSRKPHIQGHWVLVEEDIIQIIHFNFYLWVVNRYFYIHCLIYVLSRLGFGFVFKHCLTHQCFSLLNDLLDLCVAVFRLNACGCSTSLSGTLRRGYQMLWNWSHYVCAKNGTKNLWKRRNCSKPLIYPHILFLVPGFLISAMCILYEFAFIL